MVFRRVVDLALCTLIGASGELAVILIVCSRSIGSIGIATTSPVSMVKSRWSASLGPQPQGNVARQTSKRSVDFMVDLWVNLWVNLSLGPISWADLWKNGNLAIYLLKRPRGLFTIVTALVRRANR